MSWRNCRAALCMRRTARRSVKSSRATSFARVSTAFAAFRDISARSSVASVDMMFLSAPAL